MILRIPDSLSGKFKIENDLLVERVNLIDSIFKKEKLKMGLLLPFKAKEIIFDSIENTKKVLRRKKSAHHIIRFLLRSFICFTKG